MKTAIIIPTYNRPHYLKQCLESLYKTYLPKDTLIYIIDDGSDQITKTLIKEFNPNCLIKREFKTYNTGLYHSLLTSYDYCFNNDYEYVILLGSDVIVNNYFYDMMIYYKTLFPNNIISGFNTLTCSELNAPRHKIIYNGGFYVMKNTAGSAGTGIDKFIYETYIKPTLLKQLEIHQYKYDTIASNKASKDGINVICTIPSVVEHIGLNSSLNHNVNPDISIDFREYIELDNLHNNKKQITINLATYPKRKEYLKILIEKLLSINIIDKIRVYLNEYEYVPDFLYNEKIEYVIGLENIKDSGKYHWAYTYKDEYYFTIDDDLLIDENFIKDHINTLNKYNNEIFVSLHGKILNTRPSHFRDVKQTYHCLQTVLNDEWVNFPGTGVMVFDNSKYKLYPELFEFHGMTDLWVALFLQRNQIPCIVRNHKENDISLIYTGNETLWNLQNELKAEHNKILHSINNWKLYKK